MLNRSTPEEGIPIKEYIRMKYGAAMAESVGRPDNPLSQAGRAVGIEFNSSRNIIPTLQCHALLEWFYSTCTDEETDEVSPEGMETANKLMELLFKNYFEQGVNLNYDIPATAATEGAKAAPLTVFSPSAVTKSSGVTMDSVFVKCALEAGIPREKLQVFVDGFPARLGGQLSSAVLAKDDHAKNRMRVNGVPCFVMETQNGRKPVVVSGGQPVQAMIGYLRSCVQPA